MNGKLMGGILLIVGTSIGGGMLALPITIARAGFLSGSVLLLLCWALMTFGAFLVLEVNMWLPAESNLISMSRATLGRAGEIITWLSYLLLFYALLSAYVSSGADILQHVLQGVGISLPTQWVALIFVTGLGAVVYHGIRSIDYVNRGLMFTKLSAYFTLVACVIGYVNLQHLAESAPRYAIHAVTVTITSYGFASIIPSLRTYFNGDIKKLRRVILIGSCIPLFCYILWDLAILGTLPLQGPDGLLDMLVSGHSTTELTESLSAHMNNGAIKVFSHIFTSVCVATSFLGVSLALSDFLADGFKLPKVGFRKWLIYSATFLPPVLISIYFPNIFIQGLSYAGVLCAFLLIVLPALMAWSSRYYQNIHSPYVVFGGKISLLIMILLGLVAMSLGVIENWPH